MSKKPRILLTNDDGIHAVGLRHLYHALKGEAEIVVVAPVDERSACALSLTVRHPLEVKRVSWEDDIEAWAVSGTPADCIKLALSQYISSQPDIIVCGINPGTNAGRNLLYSGTVGGAIEGIMHDVPSLAFSMLNEFDPDYTSAEPHIRAIVHYVLENPLPLGTLLNVNFPDTTYEGLKFTRQGSGMLIENPDQKIHPTDGKTYYWIGKKEIKEEKPEDTDTWWLQHGYITAVPVHIAELTDHRVLADQKHSFEALFDPSPVR